ncbi:hypothetical protein FB451DRAFT_1406026 [Mycena latifolia]|nr:hypothetical protein FB451DRAFT_1406026 [Mycena latifolia]
MLREAPSAHAARSERARAHHSAYIVQSACAAHEAAQRLEHLANAAPGEAKDAAQLAPSTPKLARPPLHLRHRHSQRDARQRPLARRQALSTSSPPIHHRYSPLPTKVPRTPLAAPGQPSCVLAALLVPRGPTLLDIARGKLTCRCISLRGSFTRLSSPQRHSTLPARPRPHVCPSSPELPSRPTGTAVSPPPQYAPPHPTASHLCSLPFSLPGTQKYAIRSPRRTAPRWKGEPSASSTSSWKS